MATLEKVATFSAPGRIDSPVELKSRYENFIGGHWVAPVDGEYSTNVTPATGEPFTEVPRSTPEDVELALDAAHAAKGAWGEVSATERSRVLNKVADAIEENLEMLAMAESWENGKPVRETLAADLPLAVEADRAGSMRVERAHERTVSEPAGGDHEADSGQGARPSTRSTIISTSDDHASGSTGRGLMSSTILPTV